MKERCRRLTTDAAAKTVELLNAILQEQGAASVPAPAAKSCLSCHGNSDRRDTLGQMQCGICHPRLSEGHPSSKQ